MPSVCCVKTFPQLPGFRPNERPFLWPDISRQADHRFDVMFSLTTELRCLPTNGVKLAQFLSSTVFRTRE
jgi:hypothetical protein